MIATEYELAADLWNHQAHGVMGTIEAAREGNRRVLLTAPCGAGKTRMMVELIRWGKHESMPTALYTSRKMLFKQTSEVLDGHGIEYGHRASGFKPALLRDVQLCMTPSEHSAVYKRKSRELHPAKLVLIDEIHMQGGGMMNSIVEGHLDHGAVVVAFTATPLDLDIQFDRLIVAGTNSELRACGAHVPAITYCPDTPDLKHVKKYKVGEDLTNEDNHKAIMRPGVFGRVMTHYRKLNPEGKQTILFAPDVAGSIWFAQQFTAEGIRAASIDGEHIWVDGEQHPSTDDLRAELTAESESGKLQVLCNRFVLREGIDLPHIGHCIMATVFGSLTSYLQSGGRVIRAHPSLEFVTVQDHGGNYVRHGSLNADRAWELGQNGYKTTGIRQEAMREKPDLEPIICPRCHAARLSGPKCLQCGHEYQKRSRVVVQVDGTLKEVEGASFKPHRTKMMPDTAKKWKEMYYRAKSDKWDATFNQAIAYFFRENYYYPPKNLALMPKEPADWFEKVKRVPSERLQ